MPLPYYRNLSKAQRKIYDASARIVAVPLPAPSLPSLIERTRDLEEALATQDRRVVEAAAQALVGALCAALSVEPPAVSVRAKRPRSDWGELHGLYTRAEDETPLIEVWMRTAAHRRVVAPRTFLRTLLHEVLHHLDYDHFRLEDSLHTEGFYQRESSLVRQLAGAPSPRRAAKAELAASPPARARKPAKVEPPPPPPDPSPPPATQRQLSLFDEPAPRRR